MTGGIFPDCILGTRGCANGSWKLGVRGRTTRVPARKAGAGKDDTKKEAKVAYGGESCRLRSQLLHALEHFNGDDEHIDGEGDLRQ